MRLAVFAFSRQGLRTARRVREALEGAGDVCRTFAPERLTEEDVTAVTPPLAAFMGPLFQEMDALIFVGSCGIAVRAVAPHVRDKRTDPAVVVTDELARFVIPLLSGHIGGANALAVRLAEALGATAAVTTATDVNGRWSVDAWAAENGLTISDMKAAKAVSAAILEGPVPLASDLPVAGELPPGLMRGERGELGVCVSWRRICPFDHTLGLIPRVVRLGIGCRRGVGAEAIGRLVDQVLEENGIYPAAVKQVCTIDLKKDEPGLLEFCRERGWPLEWFSAEELRQVRGDFTPSDFVRSVTGVDNVCERAALARGETLIVKKTARDGVTVAAAAEHWEVRFGEADGSGHRPR